MVRVFIKGGVWKNSEDEILKAAVMKYGKQQWARVASLLNRKSAKQCKARWNEWLDPSVRKVEWSRAEDEKLLHLAKLMPAQWRTIGPLVGRTAAQCQERYERLLDEAAAASAGGDGEAGVAGPGGADAAAAAAAAGSGARKLRPGEIDTHPETKPARPDPIDMDEDEIEMLQEARARLANTQGKKAKRKAREKMLAEAKRLADLQKRRELKQAGLLSGAARTKARGGKKRRREIDFGVEIPFHKPAPAGFHSTEDEDDRAEQIRTKRRKDVDYKRINEAQYRSRDREAAQAQKKEEARLRSLERSNMQYVVAEVSKRNDPIAARKRGQLKMPEPAITDEELGRVARLGREAAAGSAAAAAAAAGSGTGGATDALLGDYADRPLPTPMRTPAVGAGRGDQKMSSQEIIMREASNLRMIQQGQTPLLGGDNPLLRDGGAGTGIGLPGDDVTGGSGAAAAAAASANAATPMMTELPGATPMTDRAVAGQTPIALAPRDELGLNRPGSQLHPSYMDDAASVGGTSFATSAAGTMSIKEIARQERRAAKRARRELELALASLPAPQFEYELAAPDIIPEDDDDAAVGPRVKSAYASERDAADVEAEKAEQLRQEAIKLYEARSTVVKRPDLPRPFGAIQTDAVLSGEMDEAEGLIRKEMLGLLQQDAFAHPVVLDPSDPTEGKKSKKKGKKRKKNDVAAEGNIVPPPDEPLDYIPEENLDEAKELLEKEAQVTIDEKAKELRASSEAYAAMKDCDVAEILASRNAEAAVQGASDQTYKHKWEPDATKEDRLASLKLEYEAIREAANATKKKADKLESKLAIKNGGYIKRAAALQEAALQTFAETQNARIEESVYSLLMSHERRGIGSRIEKLQKEIEVLEEGEAAAQKRYGELMHTKNRLLVKLRQK